MVLGKYPGAYLPIWTLPSMRLKICAKRGVLHVAVTRTWDVSALDVRLTCFKITSNHN